VPNDSKPYPPEFGDQAVRRSPQRGDGWKNVAHGVAGMGSVGDALDNAACESLLGT
jgi:hypothetical protein